MENHSHFLMVLALEYHTSLPFTWHGQELVVCMPFRLPTHCRGKEECWEIQPLAGQLLPSCIWKWSTNFGGQSSLPHLSIFSLLMEDPTLHMVVPLSQADLKESFLERLSLTKPAGRIILYLLVSELLGYEPDLLVASNNRVHSMYQALL